MKAFWSKKRREPNVGAIVGGAVALLGTYAFYRTWHDLRRYLNIRHM